MFTKVFGVYTLAVQLVPSIVGGNGFTRCNSVSMSGDGNSVLVAFASMQPNSARTLRNSRGARHSSHPRGDSPSPHQL